MSRGPAPMWSRTAVVEPLSTGAKWTPGDFIGPGVPRTKDWARGPATYRFRNAQAPGAYLRRGPAADDRARGTGLGQCGHAHRPRVPRRGCRGHFTHHSGWPSRPGCSSGRVNHVGGEPPRAARRILAVLLSLTTADGQSRDDPEVPVTE